MDSNTQENKSTNTKKQLKKDLEFKIESALPELKTSLGEKKFHRRVKKATKVIVQGLHKKDLNGKNNKAAADDALAAVEKAVLKKIKSKKEE